MAEKYVVFWDIGNVLIKFKEKEIINFLGKNRLPELSKKDFNTQYSKIIGDSFLGAISLSATWKKLFSLTKIDKDKQETIKKKYKILVNTALIDFIKIDLKHCQLGIISDLHQIAYHQVIKSKKDVFSSCQKNLTFLSNQIGKSKLVSGVKYFKEIFKIAKKYNKKIIYIDDEIQYTSLANKLKVKTILFPKIKQNSDWKGANKIVVGKMKDLNII